ncbi:DUF475 domain-containing protein [Tissierella creatinini]|nr:DUF475 domain-containing protein [Tissierella creatinini]TJX62806.1 DUF475 domain-containing protein [Soehngenia saccharolytica]
MVFLSIIFTIFGLCIFEIVSSIDNAVINAEVLGTMSEKGRKWFLFYGILFAVFIVRGFLPWLIVWVTNPALGFMGSLTATFSNDPHVIESIEQSTPILMLGGGIFLVFLFLHWLFIEDKHFGLQTEELFLKNGAWFYAVVSLILVLVVALSIRYNPILALSAVIGSSAFFITDGFKKNAEENEMKMLSNSSSMTDLSKILYLEIIDMSFSIDGVLGAFAFTMSVPIIILGNGLGAIVVRQLTMGNIENIKKYIYLKNGAMYSIFVLGLIMVLEGFNIEIPSYVSPLVTTFIIAFFFLKSKNHYSKHVLKH